MNEKNSSKYLWLALLMLIVCLPRVTIDAYLPSLPAMADALHSTDAQLQMTLTMYMAGYAFSMLIAGPLSDRYGRRPVLIGGLLVYLCATAACALSNSVSAIVVARAFQALGGCSGTVIGRVIVRERFTTGVQAAMLSSISAGMALSPVVAPLAGSIVSQWLGWRGVFAVLGVIGLTALLLVSRYLPETGARTPASADDKGLVQTYTMLLCDRHFLRYSLAISFAYCTYFPFIAASSALFQRQLQASNQVYAMIFGITALGYLIGTRVFRRMNGQWPIDRVIGCAAAINLGGAAALGGAALATPTSILTIVVPMFVIMLSVGIAIPACQLAVLQPFSHAAGTASGLFFFIQMAITALCGGLQSGLPDSAHQSMILLTCAASIAFVVTFAGLGARRVAVGESIPRGS